MEEHIKILTKFKLSPYLVLENEKDRAKFVAAINKSIKLLQKQSSRNKTIITKHGSQGKKNN